eukprot:9382950-Pyramimonas_sp.AAC.1
MQGGQFSTCGSRLNAAHTRLLKSLQHIRAWRAIPFQNVALDLAPCAFVVHFRNSLRGSCGRSPRHRHLTRSKI